jgi:RNA polymerase sigma-70 factor (ECF subfamily)
VSDGVKQWVQQARGGSEDAFEWLYARYAPRVKAYFLRCGFIGEADDVLQETFLRAFGSLSTYDADKGAFATWLGAIARNVARKRWRKKNGPPDAIDPELAAEVLTRDDADPPQTREELSALDGCVHQLPSEKRALIELRYVKAMTTRGMAEELDIPESTVRLRLAEAMAELRTCLGGKGFRA